MNDQKLRQEGKPLTAEEILKEWSIVPGDCKHRPFEDIIAAMRDFAAQQTAWKDARIAELEVKSTMVENLVSELAVAGKERDLMKEERNRALNDFAVLQFSSVQAERRHLKELEAVKKERDETIECMNYFENSDKEGRMAMVRFAGQRDKASAIILRYVDIQGRSDQHRESDLYHHTFNEGIPFLESLSSGETKPVSPWISVEERLPEVGQSVAFVVASTVDEHNNGRVLGGRYDGFKFGYHGFSTPGVGWAGSHWTPLPASPESLTDKK